MKKLKMIALMMVVLSWAPACSKNQKVSSEKIIGDIVTSMCKKMKSCHPDAVPEENACQAAIKMSLSNSKELEKLEADEKQLKDCIAGIDGMDCEVLMGAQPPKGCEFLK